MLIGAHVSVSHGYAAALDYAQSVGAECIQIFAKSPRQWKGPSIDQAAADAFVAERRSRGFGPVFTHSAYLINLATDDPALGERSVAALADELVRGAQLQVAGVVTHLGSDQTQSPALAARRVAGAIRRAYDLAGDAASDVRLLLENTAGAGRTFGSTFEELADCISATGLGPDRLGICLDTCHAFARGMRLDSTDGWRESVAQIIATCGSGRLGLIHANDCLYELGSRRDRHAWIGDGFMGMNGFAAMFGTPEIQNVPACVEMPGEVPEKDRLNIERLRLCRSSILADKID